MTIIVAGGTGFLGMALLHRLLRDNHSIVLLTRNSGNVSIHHPHVRVAQWDGRVVGDWVKYVDGADAIVNLTGELIAGKRWTKRQKEIILGSRVDATRAIVKAIEQASKKPSVLVSASAVGYYGNVPSGDVPESFPKGNDFLAMVCGRWEEEALVARKLGIRIVTPRLGVVLAGDGGALKKMVLPFRWFIGGPIGNGRQWLPWIHRDDVVDGIVFLLQSSQLAGAVNFVAPEPATMKQFSRALGRSLRRPSWIPVPSFILHILLGEMAGMLLTGQRAVPQRLMDAGFVFQYPGLDRALSAIAESSCEEQC